MQNSKKKSKTYFKDYEGNSMFFVTIICKNRKPIHSSVVNNEVLLTKFGEIVEKIWNDQADIHPQVEMGKYVLMPNHLYGIIKITQNPKKYKPKW